VARHLHRKAAIDQAGSDEVPNGSVPDVMEDSPRTACRFPRRATPSESSCRPPKRSMILGNNEWISGSIAGTI
jgi:hypothetical protein